MMCIPFICMFICMFVGLPSWVSVVCGLVVCWLKNVPFSFLLVSPFPALSEHCPDACVLTWRKCIQMYEGKYIILDIEMLGKQRRQNIHGDALNRLFKGGAIIFSSQELNVQVKRPIFHLDTVLLMH